MLTVIEAKKAELAELCRRHNVKRLELFGSAARIDALPPRDLDFLVEFQPMEPVAYKRAYFALLADLEMLFSMPVDLLTAASLRNRHLVQSVNESRREVYAG